MGYGEPVPENAPLISVVVPAYNASCTLDATLWSIRLQTYGRLQIAVVDDGSTDSTARIIQRHVSEDPRIFYYHQPNAGVSAARDLGIARTQGELVAFCDADDLWAREKIARQLQVFEAAEDDLALVYTWFAVIDEANRIQTVARPQAEGWTFETLCVSNFIGNGSTALVRRSALERVGGFDAKGHGRKLAGAEDYALFLAIAEHYRFGVVREPLVGYRQSSTNMTSNVGKMIEGFEVMAADVLARRPDVRPLLQKSRRNMLRHLLNCALTAGSVSRSLQTLRLFFKFDPLGAAATTLRLPVTTMQAAAGRRSVASGPNFA